MKRRPLSRAAAGRHIHAERGRHTENGDTLIEVLMTLIVLSIAVLALIIAFATGISASVDHRNLATNDAVLRQAEEEAFYQIQQQSAPAPLYMSCAPLSHYSDPIAGVQFDLPSGYTVTWNSIQYWDTTTTPAQFDGTCAANSPQLISLTVKQLLNGSIATTTFVVDDLGAGPASSLTVTSVSPSSAVQGTSNLALSLSGTGFASGATAAFSGSGVTVNSATFVTPTMLDLNVSIATTASVGTDSITVTNPGGAYATGASFTVYQLTTTGTTGMHVSAMTSFNFFLPIWPIVAVSVEDGSNHLMRHVTVSGTWSPSSGGGFTTSTCVTDGSGTCYLIYGFLNFSPVPGPVTYTVSGLVSTGYTYKPATNNPNPPVVTVNLP